MYILFQVPHPRYFQKNLYIAVAVDLNNYELNLFYE